MTKSERRDRNATEVMSWLVALIAPHNLLDEDQRPDYINIARASYDMAEAMKVAREERGRTT